MDAEEDIDHHWPNEGVTSGSAKVGMDGVEEVADSPKEKEDGDMEERMYPGHKPHHMEIFEASK